MNGDRRHARAEIARQVRGRHRRQDGRLGRRAGQHGTPLEIARTRAGDRSAVGGCVWRGPVTPRAVGCSGVAGPRRDLHLRAGRELRLPLDGSPRGDGDGVAHIGGVGATGRAIGREPEDLAWVRCRKDDPSLAVGQECGDLLGVGTRDERRLERIAGQAEDLPLVTGGEQHGAPVLERHVIGSILARLPHDVPGAVGQDAIERAGHGSCAARGRLGCGGPGACIRNDRDAGDFGRNRCDWLARRVGISPCRGRRQDRATVHGGRIDGTVDGDAQRVDLAVGGLEQHERFARRIDLKDTPGRLRPGEQPSLPIECEGHGMRGLRFVEDRTSAVGRDLVDHPLVARGREHIAGSIDGEAPDVAVRRVEENAASPGCVHLVDLPVWRCAHVQATCRPRGDRMHLKLLGIEEERAGAGCVDLVHLAFVAAADVDVAIRSRHHRPEKRSRRLIQRRRRRAQRQTAVTVDGEVLDVTAQEFRLRRDLPEGRHGGRQNTDGQAQARRNKTGSLEHGLPILRVGV